MKILMIAPQPFFEERGTPISVLMRLQALSALEYEVDLITYHVGADVDIPGVTIYRTPRLPFVKNVKIGPSWLKPILDILIFLRLLGRLLTTRYDLLHTHEEAAYFGGPIAALFGIPHVYDMHSSLPAQLENFGFGHYRLLVKAFAYLENQTLRHAALVITIGEDLAAHVRRVCPDSDPITIENFPLRISAARFDEGQKREEDLKEAYGMVGRRLLVYTGTFERYQGLDILLQSVAEVVAEAPEALFVLVGGRPDQIADLQEQAAELGVEEFVRFTGRMSLDEAFRFASAAEVLLSPRVVGTSIPIKLYDYLIAGRPILATRIPAHTLLLNDDIAYLVEPNSADMSRGLLDLLRSADQRLSLSQNMSDFVREHYNFDTYIAQFRTVFESLVRQTCEQRVPVDSEL